MTRARWPTIATYAACAALSMLSAASARAEPYLALKTSLKCSSCHLNRTGGGGRTTYGAGFGRQTLPAPGVATLPDVLDGAIGTHFRIGADFRAGDIWSFREDAPNLQEFDILGAQLYLFADVVPERLALYIDERVAPGGAFNREVFLLVRHEPAHLYAKAGRFFLPYGIRLQDDGAATRRYTGFSMASSDTGLEIGYEPGPFALAIAFTNGNGGATEDNNGKETTFTGAYVHKAFRVGLSASHNSLPDDAIHDSAGLFLGARAGPVVFLAEADVLEDDPGDGTPERDGSAAHAEIDWTIRRGITVRAWAGGFDPNRDGEDDELDQAGLAVDWTALPGLQVRAWYRVQDGPEGAPTSRDDQAVVELHLYF